MEHYIMMRMGNVQGQTIEHYLDIWNVVGQHMIWNVKGRNNTVYIIILSSSQELSQCLLVESLDIY